MKYIKYILLVIIGIVIGMSSVKVESKPFQKIEMVCFEENPTVFLLN